jgi:hypothetical protein
VIPGGPLPAHAAARGDHLERLIALAGWARSAPCRSAPRPSAAARRRRHDDGGTGMARGDRGVDVVPLEGAVGGGGGDRTVELVERGAGPGAVVGIGAGQRPPSRRCARCVSASVARWSSRHPPTRAASWCRASRPATRPGRRTRAPCGPPAGAPARRSTAPAAAPGSPPGGSGSDGRAPGDRAGRSRPSRARMEAMRPSVRRSARRNTARRVRAVMAAGAEYRG